MNVVDMIGMEQMRKDIPQFKAGDTLKVHVKIVEGDKQRIQLFQGVCIARHNKGVGSSFMVRKISNGVGVERVFPLHAPTVEKIEVLTIGRVRRAKLYYLRKLQGKAARIRELRKR
jgi:large subunit ribosomal protein L19